MTYPSGVQLATLTFSNPITFLGNAATRTEVTVQSTAGVVWSATGEPIDDFAETVAPGAGMPGSLTAPFVDQPGFTDQAGNAFTMWAYVVTRLTWCGSSVKTVRKNWQPVVGQDTIDFDSLPGGNIGLPVSAPIVPVTSVAGLTAAVGAESLADVLSEFMPIPDVSGKLDASAAATTYATKSVETTKLDASARGAASGVAPLGADSKVPDASLPARLQDTALVAAFAPAALTTTVAAKADTRKDGLVPITELHPSKALLPFYAALADRDTNPCDILVCGDSISEGQAASTVTARWLDKLATRMRTAFPVAGVAGGSGFVPAWYAFPLAGQAFTASGYTINDTSRGLGRRSVNLGNLAASGGPGKLTITRRCTGFTVYTARAATGVNIVVDGGAPITSAVGSGIPVQATTVTGLTAGNHTIEITKNGAEGTSVYCHGVMFYEGDETKGIRFWDGSKSGTRAEHFALANGATGTDLWADMLANAVTPDLVVMGWITNDYIAVTPAAYETHVRNFITLVRSRTAGVPVLLMPMFERNAANGLAPWGDYLLKLQTIAADTPNVAYIDLGERIPKLSPDSAGLLSDGVHPNDKGYSFLADTILGAIRPR